MSPSPSAYQNPNLVSTWDKVSADYDFAAYWRLPDNHANVKTLLTHIGNPEEKHIIEVGSGSGFSSLALAQRGALCSLLDLSPLALQVGTDAFIKAGRQAPKLFLEDALKNSVPSDSYDVVWNGGVIEHFVDSGKQLLLLEMLRMCKPGGTVIILVPNRWCWEFQIVQAWQKFWGTWRYGFEDDMSPRRLGRMCETVGITQYTSYAFNPVIGWRWLPLMRYVLKLMGCETLERHCRKTWMGFVSVLVIPKPGSPAVSNQQQM